MNTKRHTFAALALAIDITSPLMAEVELDQFNEPGTTNLFVQTGILNNQSFRPIQTFTVGIDGTLDSVDIRIDQRGTVTDDLVVEIVSGDSVDGDALATVVLAASDIPSGVSYITADFSSASLEVSIGDVLGYRLSSEVNFTNTMGYVALGGQDTYSGGNVYRTVGDTLLIQEDNDFFFRTYVDAADVLLGDVNLDGAVDLLDVDPFIDLIATGEYQIEADINQDGIVNLLDVDPFIELL